MVLLKKLQAQSFYAYQSQQFLSFYKYKKPESSLGLIGLRAGLLLFSNKFLSE